MWNGVFGPPSIFCYRLDLMVTVVALHPAVRVTRAASATTGTQLQRRVILLSGLEGDLGVGLKRCILRSRRRTV
jgi:hypothetical protein